MDMQPATNDMQVLYKAGATAKWYHINNGLGEGSWGCCFGFANCYYWPKKTTLRIVRGLRIKVTPAALLSSRKGGEGERGLPFGWAHINLANVFCNKRPIAISHGKCSSMWGESKATFVRCASFLLNNNLETHKGNSLFILLPPPPPLLLAMAKHNWPIWRYKAKSGVFKAFFLELIHI